MQSPLLIKETGVIPVKTLGSDTGCRKEKITETDKWKQVWLRRQAFEGTTNTAQQAP
jgi:hypothetical protein